MKNNIFKKTLKPTIIISCILALLFLPINYKYSTSILIGTFFSLVYLYKLEKDVDYILSARIKKSYFSFMLNLLILITPFIMVVIFPESMDFIGAFIGLMVNKVIFYAMNLIRKE